MPKCYALGMFEGEDTPSFLAAVEKDGPIRRFTLDGEPLETVAPGPGGVMTITQVPGRKDQFLATRKFFSPNFGGDDAAIASYTKQADGSWSEQILCDLPYVHRFGILKAVDGQLWIIACTIKGGAETGVKDRIHRASGLRFQGVGDLRHIAERGESQVLGLQACATMPGSFLYY